MSQFLLSGMSSNQTIKASIRGIKKSSNKLIRNSGGIPAVLYGNKVKNQNLALNSKEFGLIYKTVGESTVLNLLVDGEKAPRNVLIHGISLDPVRDFITHVDFYEVNMDKKIKTTVPLVFEGESPAVKSDGGVLIKNTYEVEVEALPKDLPHEIIVDISKLINFQDVITLADLPISANVKIYGDFKEIIAKVAPPRTESEIAALSEEIVSKVDDVKVESEEKRKEKEAAKEAAASEK